MDDDLLNYYERELTFIREMGAEFAKKYPKIASRLLLEPDKCEDPHTERLIEAFSLLSGRIHKKIDDDFPEITESCAATNEPHRLADYLHRMAGEFHLFYHKHTVLSGNLPLTAARLGLCEATRIVLRNGLTILGIQAPQQM